MERILEFRIEKPERLDMFVSKSLGVARSQVARLIKNGAVYVDARQTQKPGCKLKEGQSVRIELPRAKTTKEEKPVDFSVEILYEDDSLLVIDKPSGVTVHPAPSVKEATLVDWLKYKGIKLSTISGEERHGIVHRLDKGTSGVMVVAKTDEAHRLLAKQLEDKSMGRYYLAIIAPPLKPGLTIVDRAIARNRKNRVKMAYDERGRSAKSAFLPLLESNDANEQCIACKLFTGRTHQIRVHLESIGRTIVGDALYGGGKRQNAWERILLHAYAIYFRHPKTQEFMRFFAPYDESFASYLRKKFDTEKLHEKTRMEYIVERFDTLVPERVY